MISILSSLSFSAIGGVDMSDQKNPVTKDLKEWGIRHPNGEAIDDDWLADKIRALNQKQTRLPWLINNLSNHHKVIKKHKSEGQYLLSLVYS